MSDLDKFVSLCQSGYFLVFGEKHEIGCINSYSKEEKFITITVGNDRTTIFEKDIKFNGNHIVDESFYIKFPRSSFVIPFTEGFRVLWEKYQKMIECERDILDFIEERLRKLEVMKDNISTLTARTFSFRDMLEGFIRSNHNESTVGNISSKCLQVSSHILWSDDALNKVNQEYLDMKENQMSNEEKRKLREKEIRRNTWKALCKEFGENP